MQFSAATTATAALALFTTATVAQDVQSAPFNLTVTTADNSFVNGAIAACHEGAAIESLCLVRDGAGSQFNLNTTSGQQAPAGSTGSGALTWTLPGSNFQESEAMRFSIDPSTNVAHPQFFPDNEATFVAFDDQNYLNILSYVDDTVTPPTYRNATALYRWYVCTTYSGSYTYTTVDWLLGNGSPQNPSCVSAQVKRTFV